MTRRTLLLENGFVAALDDADTVGWLSVAVQGDRIAAVGPADELRDRFPAAERFGCGDRILVPGLVNAHLHPELHVLKGTLEGLALHEWGAAALVDTALRFMATPDGAEIQRVATLAALADALLCGTTTVGTYGVSGSSELACADALEALGLRGTITLRDRDFKPVRGFAVPCLFRLHAEEELDRPELDAAAAAHARGERLVMHCAETAHRRELSIRRFGASPVRLLDRYGLLSPRTLLSHAVHVDEAERELLARRDVPIVSSPTAEMKLSDGIAPVSDYLARGMTVALGTDAAVCNNSNDLWREMRELGLTQKLRNGAGAVPAERILRMATRDGARALGLPDRSGAIAPGCRADLALLDTRNPRLRPLFNAQISNVATNLVYAATGQDVTDVMIGGEWVVRGRRVLALDQDALWDRLQQAGEALLERITTAAVAGAAPVSDAPDRI